MSIGQMEMQASSNAISEFPTNQQQADTVSIIYYTDPLCCWSWGFEPQWRRLLYEYAEKISFRYCMGGLLPAWQNYQDTVNSITRPVQMGPMWMHARQLSGMPFQTNIWHHDPPASSYPACIAVKCAERQTAQAGDFYLRMLREAVMKDGKNIAKQQVLWQIAETLPALVPTFDVHQFQEDMKTNVGLEGFRADLQEVQRQGITRFPSLIIKNAQNQAVLFSGYRPYSALISSLQQVASLEKTNPLPTPEQYKAYRPFLTEREMSEWTGSAL